MSKEKKTEQSNKMSAVSMPPIRHSATAEGLYHESGPPSMVQVSPEDASQAIPVGIFNTRPPPAREHFYTSVKALEMKDIVLTTGSAQLSSLLKDIVHKSSRITLVPYAPGLEDRICERCVFICLNRDSIQDKKYLEFIDRIIEKKQKDAGTQKVVRDFLSPKLILLDGLTIGELPENLKVLLNPLKFTPKTPVERIIEFIEGRFEKQVRKTKEDIQRSYQGPVLHIIVQAKLLSTENPQYLKRISDLTKETFEDASSYPRQILMQLYKMANVRVKPDMCVPPDGNIAEKIYIEIRPLGIDNCVEFLKSFMQNSSFPDMLRNHVKINGHSFIGHYSVSIVDEDLVHLFQYFIPDLSANDLSIVKGCLETKDVETLEKLVAENMVTKETQETQETVPKLKVLAATNIYQRCLSNESCTPYAFLRYIRSMGFQDAPETIRSMQGYNTMHLAIIAERIDYLKMIFYHNKWHTLFFDVVQPYGTPPVTRSGPNHTGYTPRRLAEALSYKSKGYDVLLECEKLDKTWRHLAPVMRVCLAGSLERVSLLVEDQSDLLHYKDNRQSNLLLYACASGNTKLVSYLLAKNVARNVRNEDGETALHMTAMFGHIDVLEVLFASNFDIVGQSSNMTGYTALDYCAMNGDIDVLRLYKEKGFHLSPKLLTLAARNKQSRTVEFLVRCEDSQPNDGTDDEGRLALHYEVMNGSLNTVKLLIEKDADITRTDMYKKNIFHLAADSGHLHVVKYLLSVAKEKNCLKEMLDSRDIFIGKDLLYVVRGKDRGRKVWHWVELRRLSVKGFKTSLYSGQIDVASYGNILGSGFGPGPDAETQEVIQARSNSLTEEKLPDMTPLHVAVMKDFVDIAKELLQSGADPDATDKIGATPMHFAAMTGNIEVLKLLEAYKGDILIRTSDAAGKQQTPSEVAEENLNTLAANFIKAIPTLQKAQAFLDKPVATVAENLSMRNLELKRSEGSDVRRYVIDALRDLTIDINEVLFDLGSGPILEESRAIDDSSDEDASGPSIPIPTVYN